MEIDVPARDLRNHTAKILDDVADGQTVYITRNGERVAMLTPLRRARHPANERLLRALDAMRPRDTGWHEELMEQRAADTEADERRLDWLFASDPHPGGPDAHAERERPERSGSEH
ncbi:MAG: type II toxin-antitoxin system prevent-host-death family antitoxin [Actinomycetota bacterium]